MSNNCGITEPQVHKYEEINVGDKFEFRRSLTREDINNYAKLIGDYNPLHVDEQFAQNTFYQGIISHGMLPASLFSTLLGMYCPGKNSIILSLSVKFKKPVRPDINLVIRGEVINKVTAYKILTIKTTIICEQEILIEGEAKTKML